MDRATDAVIQQALRDYTKEDPTSGRVLLIIAHRIDTVMDCDHLLVLSNGQLLEQGPPLGLVRKPGGLFAAMASANTK